MPLNEYGISIHALREEGDYATHGGLVTATGFLSTPSARRATSRPFPSFGRCPNFYPRPPRGGRRGWFRIPARLSRFLSTPSARRATPALEDMVGVFLDISIHALREEGDRPALIPLPPRSAFLSTPSARRATWPPVSTSSMYSNFYPRPPRGGRLLSTAVLLM